MNAEPRLDYLMNRYFAGLFDGEGCIVITKKRIPSGKEYFYLQATLDITYKPVLHRLQFCYGGAIYDNPERAAKHPEWSEIYKWAVNSKECYEFLKCIQPYSTVKRKEIEAAIEFFEAMAAHTEVRGGRGEQDSIAYLVGDHYFKLLKSLKSRNNTRTKS